MTVGQIAGLIAAVAAVAFVSLCAIPLIKLGKVLDELRVAVRDLGQESVPILTELKGTVTATNDEIGKLAVVTEDVAKVSNHATTVAENTATVAKLVTDTVAPPLIKAASLTYGVKEAVKGRGRHRKEIKAGIVKEGGAA